MCIRCSSCTGARRAGQSTALAHNDGRSSVLIVELLFVRSIVRSRTYRAAIIYGGTKPVLHLIEDDEKLVESGSSHSSPSCTRMALKM